MTFLAKEFFRKVPNRIGFLAAWLVIPLMLVTCLEVASRYFFSSPTAWSYEIGYMLTGAHFLLGLGFTLEVDSHVRVDVLYSRFSRQGKSLVNALGFLVYGLPALILIDWALVDYFYQAYLSGEGSGQSGWNPQVWPFRLIFVIALMALTLQCLLQTIEALRDLFSKSKADQ